MLGRRQSVAWPSLRPTSTIVTFGLVAPTLYCANGDANDPTCWEQTGSRGLCLGDRAQDQLALGPSVSSSSS
jgi:hypothetical protein